MVVKRWLADPSPHTPPGPNLICCARPRKPHTKTEKIQSLYVRRELRKLSDLDRDAYLDAFKVMTSTSTADGKAVYGQHYKDLDEFSVR